MKFTTEQTTERQISHHKNTHNHEPCRRTMQMGDCPTNSNSNCYDRPLDPVSCWGDVPKRPTRFADLLSDTNLDSVTSNVQRPVNPRTVTNRNSPSDSSSPSSPEVSKHTVNNPDSPSHKQKSSSKTNTGTAGRERLLEWLRTSQAKRDENNRQVLTKWIAKMENLNAQAMAASNYNQTMFTTTATTLDSVNPIDYQSTTLFPFNPTLSTPIATPTLWIGNSMGLLTSATAVPSNTAAMQFRVPPPVSTNQPTPYLPSAQLPTKPLSYGGQLFPQNFFNHFIIPNHSPKTEACGVGDTISPELQQNCIPEVNSQAEMLQQNNLSPSYNEELKQCSEVSTKLGNQVGTGLGNLEVQDSLKNGLTTFALDPSLIRGGCYQQPVYITTTTNPYETTSPQTLYYCYVPTNGQPAPVAYGFPPQCLTKFPGLTQPFVYLMHPNVSYSSSQCPTDEVTGFGQAIHPAAEAQLSGKDNSTPQQAQPTTETFCPVEKSTDDLCGQKACFQTTDRGTMLGFDRLGQDESLDLQVYTRAQSAANFDFQKWYSVLNDIAQVSVKMEQ